MRNILIRVFIPLIVVTYLVGTSYGETDGLTNKSGMQNNALKCKYSIFEKGTISEKGKLVDEFETVFVIDEKLNLVRDSDMRVLGYKLKITKNMYSLNTETKECTVTININRLSGNITGYMILSLDSSKLPISGNCETIKTSKK